jgi:hypothetical protein
MMETAIKESPKMLFSANLESYIMETVIKESPIMLFSANPESPIIETAIKESPITSYSANPEYLKMENDIRGLGQSVCRRRELVQCSRNWSVRSDFKHTVKFCLYSRGKHSPWL